MKSSVMLDRCPYTGVNQKWIDVSKQPRRKVALKDIGRKEILPVGRTSSSTFSCHLEREKASGLDRPGIS